jgi:FMN phosphatase YigB (HAD superfamily)
VSPTILLDLDDTLLANSMDTFLPAYLQALGRHLAAYAPPEKMIPALLTATREMVANTRPDRTLLEVFDTSFFPALGLQAEEMEEVFASFLQDVFPGLQRFTRQLPEAVEFVEQALAGGNRLAIATSPLFPLPAILQRLEWAGLSPEFYPFCLIASADEFHFSKPHPEFYAETLARLGWPEGPVLMVGNDLHNDVEPARRLGLPVYWINPQDDPALEGPFGPTASGSLSGILPWLDTIEWERLIPNFDTPEALLAILRSTLAALQAMLAGLASASWIDKPRPGEWNLAEVVCHLRDVDGEVNLPRLTRVLEEDNPFIAGVDSDSWADERLYYCQNGPQAMQSFIAYRLALLDLLEKSSPTDWERPVRHAIFGPSRFSELVRIIAGHDRLHIHQVSETLEASSLCASTLTGRSPLD